MDLRFVRAINEKALSPDVTFFIKVRPEVAMARIEASRVEREQFETLAFQKRVAARYDEIVAGWREGEVVIIDGEEAENAVSTRVRNALDALL